MPHKTYGQAVTEARKIISQARLSDHLDHFPYKFDAVEQLLADNPPMGPGTPDGTDGTQDTSRTAEDYIDLPIANATADYIDAQAAWLEEASDANRQVYEAARDRLVAARLDHRINRGKQFVVGGAARKAG